MTQLRIARTRIEDRILLSAQCFLAGRLEREERGSVWRGRMMRPTKDDLVVWRGKRTLFVAALSTAKATTIVAVGAPPEDVKCAESVKAHFTTVSMMLPWHLVIQKPCEGKMTTRECECERECERSEGPDWAGGPAHTPRSHSRSRSPLTLFSHFSLGFTAF